MASKSSVPDAWDDDYEAVADSKANPAQSQQPAKVTRAERKARHAAENKALWNSAENPETFHYLDTRSSVPLQSDFKPAVKVLSRKPKAPEVAARPAAANLESGVDALAIADDDLDSEEEARREQERSLRQRTEQARREREEKQRKYAEVRERLFGSPGGATPEPVSGRSSPTRAAIGGGNTRATRSVRGAGQMKTQGSNTSSADQSPARAAGGAKLLYDPDYTGKPNSLSAQKYRGGGVPVSVESQTVRTPKGPDGSGRGGFGFGSRGGKTAAP